MAKYLVITHYRAGQAHPSDVKSAGARAKSWIQELQSTGKIETAYTFAAGGGGAAVIDAASQNELQALLAANPSAQHVTHETYELTEFATGFDQVLGKI
jgi:hypothetical protein